MTDFLSYEEVLDVVEQLGFDIRDSGLIAAAVGRPQTSAFGQDAYPTLYDKAAALLQSLAAGQGLNDGNKRTGWVCTRAFLSLNGIELDAPVDEAEEFIRAIDHRTEWAVISARLASWTSSVDITE